MYSASAVLCVVFYYVAVEAGIESEPQCLSRFDYEYKLAKKMAQMEVEMEKLHSMITELKEAKSDNIVAFSATMTKTTENLPRGTTVIFDHVSLNIGSRYDPHHGVFTAQHHGIYSFTITLAATNAAQFWLVKNGDGYEYTFVSNSKWDTGSATITMELTSGDRVWVQGLGTIPGFEAYSCKPNPCYHNSFTGFLISIL